AGRVPEAAPRRVRLVRCAEGELRARVLPEPVHLPPAEEREPGEDLQGDDRRPAAADAALRLIERGASDLLVVGGGPAGLAAAVEAAAVGLSVTLVDEGPPSGGPVFK